MHRACTAGVAIVLYILGSLMPLEVKSLTFHTWQTLQSLPNGTASHAAITLNGRVFVLGGGDATNYRSDIYSALVNSDNTLSDWTKKGDLPVKLIWHSVVNVGDYFYALGGAIANPDLAHTASVNTVYKAVVDSNGDIGTWSSLTPLPQKIGRGGSFSYNNRIYSVGGLVKNANSSNETVVSSVYSAEINMNDGTIGPWLPQNNLPDARAEFAVFVFNDKVYIVGGMNQNGTPQNTIIIGNVNQNNGSISWSYSSVQLPWGLRRPAFAQKERLLFLIGGYDGISFTSSSLNTEISDTGELLSWQNTGSTLPHGNCCNTALLIEQSIFVFGGHDGSSYYNDVFRLDFGANLAVPNYKQYSMPWKAYTYDAANNWSPGKDTIERWGCAITSAAMVMSYHGHSITPDLLNTYLIQNNGYTRNGGVVWNKISRYTKEHESFDSPVLEYKRHPFSFDVVENVIKLNTPPIVKLVNQAGYLTHFVVLVGTANQDYYMNDPATTKERLSYYPENSYDSISVFVPSHTDLSGINLYVNSSVDINVFGPNNELITEGFEIEYPLQNILGDKVSSALPLNSFILQKPAIGKYRVELRGKGEYTMDSYLFNTSGLSSDNSFKGFLSSGGSDIYFINIGTDQSITPLTFNSIIQEINSYWGKNNIKGKAIYITLKKHVELAEKNFNKGKLAISKSFLKATIQEVKSFTGSGIETESAQTLVEHLSLLSQTITN